MGTLATLCQWRIVTWGEGVQDIEAARPALHLAHRVLIEIDSQLQYLIVN